MNINTANSNGLSKCLVVVITLCSLNSHAQNSNEDSAIEEVVVYSIRKSLESALAEKRMDAEVRAPKRSRCDTAAASSKDEMPAGKGTLVEKWGLPP